MRSIPFAFFLLLYNFVNAQTSKTDPTDAQGWYGAGIKLDMRKKWTASFDYQARFINNLETYNGSYFSFGGSKKIIKYLELLAEYRLALVKKGSYHRFSFGAEASWKIKKLEVGLRAIIQNQQQDFDDTAKLDDNSGYWRTRLSVKYGFTKKLEAHISVEPIMKFGGRYFVDNWRNEVGLKYKATKNTRLELFYIYRPDYAKTYNRSFHLVGLSVTYILRTAKKKIKNKTGAN